MTMKPAFLSLNAAGPLCACLVEPHRVVEIRCAMESYREAWQIREAYN